MRRGTTPKITLNIQDDINLTELKEIWVAFEQKAAGNQDVLLNKTKSDTNVTVAAQSVEIVLTQEETLGFSAGVVNVQMRGLTATNEAFATDIMKLNVEDIISDGVIA